MYPTESQEEEIGTSMHCDNCGEKEDVENMYPAMVLVYGSDQRASAMLCEECYQMNNDEDELLMLYQK
jgi:hypothetical protein